VGALYVFSMVGLNLTALLIYRMFGGFDVFHVLALINLTLLLAGFFAVLVKRPRKRWLRYHYYLMGWSYVGLWAATATEIMVRIVGWSPGVGTVVPTVVVTVLGGGLVQLRERQTLKTVAGGVAKT
jgi:predicted membrane channel-forming protein YqfA (hemolysin III family)